MAVREPTDDELMRRIFGITTKVWQPWRVAVRAGLVYNQRTVTGEKYLARLMSNRKIVRVNLTHGVPVSWVDADGRHEFEYADVLVGPDGLPMGRRDEIGKRNLDYISENAIVYISDRWPDFLKVREEVIQQNREQRDAEETAHQASPAGQAEREIAAFLGVSESRLSPHVSVSMDPEREADERLAPIAVTVGLNISREQFEKLMTKLREK